MGLLDKKNARATPRSVIRSALATSLVLVLVVFCVLRSSGSMPLAWPLFLALSAAAGAGLGALAEWQLFLDESDFDLFDVVFRLELYFGVKISRRDVDMMTMKNDPPDIKVGELFDFVCALGPQAKLLDREADSELLWPMFQQVLSYALGVEPSEVLKDQWLVRELGRL